MDSKLNKIATSLAVQWLGPCAFTAEGLGSIPGLGTNIPQAAQHSQKKNKTKLNKINLEPQLQC